MNKYIKLYCLGAAVSVVTIVFVLANFNKSDCQAVTTSSDVQTVMATKGPLLSQPGRRVIAEAEKSEELGDLSAGITGETDYQYQISLTPIDDLLGFDADVHFSTPEQERKIAASIIINKLGLDSGRKELVNTTIFERFEEEVALNQAYKQVLSDPEASEADLEAGTEHFNNSSELARQQYVNSLNGILTDEEFNTYKANEIALVKDYLSSRVPRTAQRLEQSGYVNSGAVTKKLESNIDSILDEKLKTGISLGLVKNDSGTFTENVSTFHMLTLATEVLHEVTQ